MLLTNKQSLYLSGIFVLAFFLGGLLNLLYNIIVQIVLGLTFLLIIVNLFLAKPLPEDLEDSETDDKKLL